MFRELIDSNFYGWQISRLESSGVFLSLGKGIHRAHRAEVLFTAWHNTSGVSMSTSTLEGIKRMIHQKNAEICKPLFA